MSNNKILKGLKYFEELENYHIEIGQQMLQDENLFAVDKFVIDILNRSMSIITGFIQMVSSNNYICAVPILRLQLDNLLRFSALHLVKNPNKFIEQYLKGIYIGNIKDKKGNKLRDWYLKKTLGKKYKWLPKVYDKTSGFVHLSNSHSNLSTSAIDDKNRIIQFYIGSKDTTVPIKYWTELAQCFILTTEILLFDYVEGWILTKKGNND